MTNARIGRESFGLTGGDEARDVDPELVVVTVEDLVDVVIVG